MHNEGVVYRDLKPENILIDAEGYIRVTDFGLSKVNVTRKESVSTPGGGALRRTQTFCGTLEYMAPEMMQNKNYTNSVDWFSFGILLFEMLSGLNPFKNENQEAVDHDKVPQRIEEILESEDDLIKKYEGTNTFSVEAYDLLEKLLRYDPEYRIGCRDAGVQEIKEHPFFASIDWGLIERKGMQAPFVPKIKDGETDVSNFDKEFTSMSMD